MDTDIGPSQQGPFSNSGLMEGSFSAVTETPVDTANLQSPTTDETALTEGEPPRKKRKRVHRTKVKSNFLKLVDWALANNVS
jgi:hypothetical protein